MGSDYRKYQCTIVCCDDAIESTSTSLKEEHRERGLGSSNSFWVTWTYLANTCGTRAHSGPFASVGRANTRQSTVPMATSPSLGSLA